MKKYHVPIFDMSDAFCSHTLKAAKGGGEFRDIGNELCKAKGSDSAMRNVWKRSLSLLLALVMVLSAVPMGALAEEVVEEEFFEEETTCDHVNYGETDYVSPDCTTAGYIEYTCWDCGESWTEEEEPYGHDYADGVCTSCGTVAPADVVEEDYEGSEDYAISTQAAGLSVDMDKISQDQKTGLIWLDKQNEPALMSKLISGGLKDLVLNAIGEENAADTKVFYNNCDVTNLVLLMSSGVQGDLEEALSDHKALPFEIQRGNQSKETVYIICRNIRGVEVSVDVANIQSKSCPADLAGSVDVALANATITITHNGDDLTELALAKGTVTITRKSGDSFSWPTKAGESVTVEDAITVAIQDDLGNHTEKRYGSLTLKDTTATYTVTYYKVAGEVYETYSVAEGSAIPVPENPERTYYKFAGWDEETDGTVTKSLTFTALWRPELDKNDDKIADQEQSFTITFDYNYPEGVEDEPDATTVSIPWGTVISNASNKPENPKLEGYVFAGWEGGSAKVAKDATVKAKWQKVDDNTSGVTEYTVTYHLVDDETFELSTVNGRAVKIEYTDTNDDYVVWKGWYTDADYKDQYNFESQSTLTANMDLYGLWLPDANNNGYADGTEEDPYTIYRFWFNTHDSQNNTQIGSGKTVWAKEETEGQKYDPLTEEPPRDSLNDDVLFVKWETKEEWWTGDQYSYVKNYYPFFTEEKNRNGIADNLEQTALQGANLENVDYNDVVSSITFAGEDVGFGEPFTRDSSAESTLVITTKPGYVVTAVTYREENVETATSLYKDEIVGEGETELPLSYSEDNRTVTVTVPKLAASDSENKYYALRIYFRDARKLVLKGSRTLDLADGITKETVYNAAVETENDASPKYDAEKVTIQYKAREATSGKVNVQKLYDAVKPYESMAPGVWNYLVSFLGLKQEGTNWFYCYELEDATCDLDAVKTIQRTPQQIVDNYIAEMVANVDVTKLNDLAQTLVDSKKQLEEKLESDTCHPFGSQAEEIVNITYKEEPWTLTAEGVTIAITDSREETSVAAPSMSFPYHSFSLNDVKAKLPLRNVKADEITLSDENIASKGVGTYTLTASFAGDATRKSCSVTFQLTITKASVAITMPKYVVHQESFSYDKVKATADGAAVLQIIAGWDAASLNLNLAAPVVSNLKGKAWVIAPDGMDDLLEAALQKLGYSTSESITLSQFTDLVTRNREVLETRLSKTNVDRLISFLNTVSAYVDAQMDIVFGEPKDVNTGIYLNLAVLADPNYEGSVDISDTSSVNSDLEFAYGGIVISPVVAIPNRGGVQLVRGSAGAAENIFSYGPGENVDLKVTVDGKEVENTIYYYGVTGRAEVYNDTVAPKASGLYVAATVYYSEDGTKIGSDSAIVIVGKYEADMTIYNTVVAQKENATFAPTYDVTRKDANKTEDNPDIIMISGKVTKADGDKLDLELLKGDIYVDVPQWLGSLWGDFVKSNVGRSFDLTESDITKVVLSKQILVDFLQWSIDRVKSAESVVGKAVNKLESLGVSNALTGKLDNWLTNNLQKALEQANKLPDGGKVIHIHTYASKDKTGNNHITHYGEVGVYYYVGIIVDSDYLPDVAAGGLVITEDEDALVLWDTEVPYDNKGHEPIAADKNAMATAMTVIRDEKGDLTILMDEDLRGALGLKAGSTLTLNQLIGEKADGADGKVESIIDKMAKLVNEKLDTKKAEKVTKKLETLTKKLKTNMVNKLQSAAGSEGTKAFTIKDYNVKNLPSAIGGYQFYTFTYGMTYDTAKLTIHPWYVSLTPKDVSINYGDKISEDFDVTAEFYSWETKRVNGNVVTQRVVTTEFNLKDAEAKYTVTCEDTKDGAAGEYKLSIESATVEGPFKVGTHGTGKLTIAKAVKTLKLTEDRTKYYDGKNDPVTMTGKLDDGTDVTYTLTYTSSDVGSWVLHVGTITQPDEANYTVTVDTNGKKMVISPAEVTVKIHDQNMTVTDTKGVLDSALVGAYTVDTTADNKGTTDLTNANITLKVADLETLTSDINLPFGKYAITGAWTSKNFTITFENGELTVGLGDYICWNMDTGVYYDDVSKALNEAVSGQTVQMLADALGDKKEDVLIVSANTTFDLNGYYVQTDNLLSYGTVIDSEPMDAEKNTFASTVSDGNVLSGGIKIGSSQYLILQQDNGGYLPIYDTVTGSYKFFKGEFKNEDFYGNNKVAVCWIQLGFESTEGYQVLARTKDSNMKLIFEISWTGISNFRSGVIYEFLDSTIQTYATHMSNNPQDNEYGIYLVLNGLGTLSAESVITSIPKFAADDDSGCQYNYVYDKLQYMIPKT